MRRRTAGAVVCSAFALMSACGRSPAPPSPAAAPPSRIDADTMHRPGNAAGAIDTLSGRALMERHAQDVAELLQGQVPGLQVIRLSNGDVTLRIRGGDPSIDPNNTDPHASEPLLVVDGMPVTQGQIGTVLGGLNPHDVKRIEVLKDVSSTAVYGIRGAHGVILITLKHE